VNDRAIGDGLRIVRRRFGLRQADVALSAGVSRTTVARLERGDLATVRIGTARQIASTLGARLEVTLRWRGAELPRLANRGHAAMHENLARPLDAAPAWISAPEVSYSIWGERGVIDRPCWHPASGTVLVVEIKTELADLEDLLAAMDRRRRLAPAIAAERGWMPVHAVAAWIVVADTRTNRRRLAEHRALLRSAYPDDGRSMRLWLGRPTRPLAGLSFMPIDLGATVRGGNPAGGRVRATRTTPAEAPSVHETAGERLPEPRPGVGFRG
jgi:transcriptional regulator with XRE-family HTH domain